MPLFGQPDVEKLKQRRDTKGLVKALAAAEEDRVSGQSREEQHEA